MWAFEEQLKVHTGFNIHQGKTQLWNAAGCKPSLADILNVAGKEEDPRRHCVEKRTGVASET